MADAKISLTTEASSEGLEKLNRALAEGQQSVASMQKELNDLSKATKQGTQATEEQAKAMVELRKSINEQKAANAEYSKEIKTTTSEIKKSVKEMAAADKGARQLSSAFKMTEGFTTAWSVALGSLAATITTGVVAAIGSMATQVVNLGAQMQQSVAQLTAMTGSVEVATESWRALNDVYRNTNFQEDTVMAMGQQLMRMGYSAQNAAGLIQLCADAAAGLGTGSQGAQQLVDAISRMQAVGELTSKQMQQLAMAGVNMDAAFKSLGMDGKQAMDAIKDGSLDSQKAITALTDYLKQYDGKMAETKNNTIDAWGDVQGNLATACAEIGNSIFDAFNQSGIIQELISFTQSLVDMIRGDGCGAFSDLRAIADEVLNFIAGLLKFVFDTIKLVIIIINDAYTAFKNFGAQVVDAIRPAVDVVLALYRAVKAVMSSIGKNFGEEVASSWGATFGGGGGGGVATANNFIQRSYGGGGSSRGGGGGGGSSSASTARAEAEAKRKAEAEAKAAKKAYEDAVKATQQELEATSKTLLDAFMGDPDSAEAKIKAIKDQLIASFAEIDEATAVAVNDKEGNLNPLAAILGMSVEDMQTEMEAKGQTLAQFVEDYKKKLAEASEAEASSIKTADKWHDVLCDYAMSVAQSMSEAMTDFIMGTKSAKEALADMVKAIIQNAIKILTEWLAVFAIYSAFPTLASGMTPADAANKTVFGVTKKATGGYITGPGSGTSDSIPAMLSNGEYVLRSSAVDRIGVGTLNAMNAGAIPQFAEGGSVGDSVAAGAGNVTLNVSTVDASSFSSFLDRGGLNTIKQALFEDNRRFATDVGVW